MRWQDEQVKFLNKMEAIACHRKKYMKNVFKTTPPKREKLSIKCRQVYLPDDPGGYRSINCRSNDGVADCCCPILLRLMAEFKFPLFGLACLFLT
jgi:hypothetical protein